MSQLRLDGTMMTGVNEQIVNVSSVKKLSPFRFPGGKTWLVPKVRQWLTGLDKKPLLFIEPFTGGGIVSLTVANEHLAERCLMVEIDDDIAAVWHTIIEGDSAALIRQIKEFDLTAESARKIFDSEPTEMVDKAFKTILRNRISHGGVLAPGAGMLKNGENGKGIHSRWYPETLADRISYIMSFRDEISFIEGDGFEVMEKHLDSRTCAFFIDPPYTASKKCAGRRLYRHHQIDHERLFEMASRMKSPFMITYDESEEIRNLCEKYNLDFRKVPMKSTHHLKRYEYLICNDFGWIDD